MSEGGKSEYGSEVGVIRRLLSLKVTRRGDLV